MHSVEREINEIPQVNEKTKGDIARTYVRVCYNFSTGDNSSLLFWIGRSKQE